LVESASNMASVTINDWSITSVNFTRVVQNDNVCGRRGGIGWL